MITYFAELHDNVEALDGSGLFNVPGILSGPHYDLIVEELLASTKQAESYFLKFLWKLGLNVSFETTQNQRSHDRVELLEDLLVDCLTALGCLLKIEVKILDKEVFLGELTREKKSHQSPEFL